MSVPDKPLQIKVKKSVNFNCVLQSNKDGIHRYNTTSKNRGIVKIINVEKVKDCQPRIGSDIDVLNIIQLFSQMGGFFIDIEQNTNTKNDIIKSLDDFSQDDSLHNADMLFVFIMSHGNNDNGSDYFSAENGEKIFYADVRNIFSNTYCKHMKCKPKILLFQTCRGNNEDNGMGVIRPAHFDGACTSNPLIPATTDLLIAYATNPNMVAMRWEHIGSPFIYCLCEEFMKWAYIHDVATMLDRVYRKMCIIEGRNYSNEPVLQTGEYLNVVFGRCYLNPGIYISKNGKVRSFFRKLADEMPSNNEHIENLSIEDSFTETLEHKRITRLKSQTELSPLPVRYEDDTETKFYQVCFDGNVAELQRLLPNLRLDAMGYRYDSGWTVLHACAFKDHLICLRILLNSKLRLIVDATDLKGNTALHIAAKHGNEKTLELLINYGADPERKNKKGQRPIDTSNSPVINFFFTRIMKT